MRHPSSRARRRDVISDHTSNANSALAISPGHSTECRNLTETTACNGIDNSSSQTRPP